VTSQPSNAGNNSKTFTEIEMSHDEGVIPETYLGWRHCITVHCGIPLTADFVARRIAALIRGEIEETLRFRKLYGDAHWRQVLAWFQRARQELEAAPNAARR
jgi:hypothetical protein